VNKLKDKINPGHYHEMMDRLHVIMSTLDDHILQHPVAKVHKELNSHLNNALEELWQAYQIAGNLDFEKNKT
jgi:hypothetical protein